MKEVSVKRTEYNLHVTDEAIEQFEKFHDNWELDVCKENPHDALVGGKYFLLPIVQNVTTVILHSQITVTLKLNTNTFFTARM